MYQKEKRHFLNKFIFHGIMFILNIVYQVTFQTLNYSLFLFTNAGTAKITTIYANGGSPTFDKEGLIATPGQNHLNYPNSATSQQHLHRTTSGSASSASSSGDLANNEFWFRMATIFFPICGAIILFLLIALAMRMLTYDGSNQNVAKLTGSSSGGPCGRKVPLDFEGAYAAHPNQLMHKHSPPLLSKIGEPSAFQHQLSSSNYGCHNDLKNETQARKNQLMTLEYSLLPQSCNDPSLKPTNTDARSSLMRTGGLLRSSGGGSVMPTGADVVNGGSGVYRNNLSLAPSKQCRDAVSDNKVYEKEALNAAPYWSTATNVRMA